jgi:phosphate/sulfate permease
MGITRRIVFAWVATILGAAVIGALLFHISHFGLK